MRVNIDEIKEGGLDRAWELTRDQVDAFLAGDKAGYRATGPARVSARLEKVGRRVLLTAKAQASLEAPCGRCLVATLVPVPVEFELTLVPDDEYEELEGGEVEDDGENRSHAASFGAEEVSEEPYHGKEIELDPIVREQLLLALPGYPVCKDACKGLCSVCGNNLNDRDCGCDRHVPDPRWAGLKNVKL